MSKYLILIIIIVSKLCHWVYDFSALPNQGSEFTTARELENWFKPADRPIRPLSVFLGSVEGKDNWHKVKFTGSYGMSWRREKVERREIWKYERHPKKAGE